MIPEQTTMPLPDLRSPLSVGMVLFPNLTQLDLTGPYEAFARLPDTHAYLVAATLTPVRTERGWTISPDVTLEDAPGLEIVCVPGGPGADAGMEGSAGRDGL